MDFDFQLWLSHQASLQRLAWAGVLLGVLFAWGVVLWAERRYFALRDKAGAWLALRCWALPLLGLCGVVTVWPSLQIGGPEALAYFYLALLVVSPLLWFGLHVLIGRCLRPPLSKGEASYLALSGLTLLLLPFMAASVAQGPIWLLGR